MASPVDTSVKFFTDEMAGTSVMSGTAGAMIAVLDACLVNGFGSKTATSLVVAGGIATLTFAGGASAAQPQSVILVAGVTGSWTDLNGEQKVISANTTTVTFPTELADGTATGTITFKMAPLGWTKVYSGTNTAVYKPSAVEASGALLRIDDADTTNARVRAYESMTDASTGAGPTPMDSQVSGGLWWPKSGTANSTARPWYMVADERGFYLALAPQGGDRFTLMFAGDIASLKSGDAYGYLLTGNQADQTALTTVPDGCCGYSRRSARGGAYMPRAYTAIGQAIAAQRLGSHHNGGTADVYAGAAGYSLGTYPNGPNNGLMTGALELHTQGIRGTLPGLMHPVQDCGSAFASGVIVDGTDDLAGRRLLAIRTVPPSGASVGGTVFIDITGPWGR